MTGKLPQGPGLAGAPGHREKSRHTATVAQDRKEAWEWEVGPGEAEAARLEAPERNGTRQGGYGGAPGVTVTTSLGGPSALTPGQGQPEDAPRRSGAPGPGKRAGQAQRGPGLAGLKEAALQVMRRVHSLRPRSRDRERQGCRS